GAALLPEDAWERRHELTFALELHRAECEFLTGEVAAADERLTVLARRAAQLVERAAVTCLRVEVYTTLGQSDRAVEVCLAYLRHLRIAGSAHPWGTEIGQACERMWKEIGSRPIEALIDLPLMTAPEWRATMEVLAGFLSPALFTHRNLFALALVSMVNLSLEHGNCDGSCLAYTQLIMVL